MLEFQLFRVKVFTPKNKGLFDEILTPPEYLKRAILLKPSAEIRKNIFWHIGNISKIGESGLYFRIGRITKSKMEIFHDGNFIDQEFEFAPYTHVILYIPFEIIAIAKKSKLSPKPIGIANNFVKLLNKLQFTGINRLKFEVSEINDPTKFIEYLQSSINITKFWVSFKRPNAFDINDFFGPLQDFLSEADGEKGKVIMEGEDLNTDPLEEIARSAGATGDDASARIKIKEGEKYQIKNLRKNPVNFQYEAIIDENDKLKLLSIIKDLYTKIRGK